MRNPRSYWANRCAEIVEMALCFLDNNRERFDFDAMFPNRYKLKDIHSAFTAMHDLRDIKPVILYGA